MPKQLVLGTQANEATQTHCITVFVSSRCFTVLLRTATFVRALSQPV